MKAYIGPFPSTKTVRKNPRAERKIQVRIDKTDTWDLFTTLAHIIHPALIAFKADTHSSANVDLADAPPEYHGTPDQYGSDDKVHERWQWALSEMIWAFERIIKQDEHEYMYTPYAPGERPEKATVNVMQKGGGTKEVELLDANERLRIGKYDRVKATAYQARVDRAFMLFGKYYQNLWS